MEGSAMDVDSTYRVSPEDLPHEEDVMHSPFSLKAWLRYLEFKTGGPFAARKLIYERALKNLPGSYKLWFNYLIERKLHAKGQCIGTKGYKAVNNAFERALVYMNKMPRIWIEYITFLMDQKLISQTRHAFDRALRALPVTQHEKLWKLYIQWATKIGVPETAMRVYKRYLKVEPEAAEDFIEYSISVGKLQEAALQLIDLLNDQKYVSPKGTSQHQLWSKLSDLLSKHPKEITAIKVEGIMREGIRRFTNEVGRLWVSLAEYYIRLANFDKARDIFEEGIHTVMSVRDFSQIWDAYTQFEDKIIEADMQAVGNDEDEVDFDLRLARYENLINQRPLLVSSVFLRQNPHNVHEWHKRAKLFPDDPIQAAKVYAEAVKTVEAKQATGKLHTLWVSYARLYERHGDLNTARMIFKKATQVEFRTVDDLASIWCEWAEMELRHKKYDEGLKILQQACTIPRIVKLSKDDPVQKKLFKSTKLWAFHADLEESLGTFVSTKAVYDKILELKVATPQIILNYAQYLEENKYYEESFRAYEKGVSMFRYPFVFDLWVAYLTKFIERYAGTKLERARDLFEQAVDGVPPKYAKPLYLMYAHVEEQYGLARHAMNVYDRACRAVEESEKPHLFNIYIARATEFFGVTKTREIYEQAISNLPEKFMKDICLRYAELEKKLGEIDRARAIYIHASQYCNPSEEFDFWKKWNDFEVRHGNEDTFREMLRVKRSVQATYNTQINVMSAGMLAQQKKEDEADRLRRLEQGDEMSKLENKIMEEQERRPMATAPGVGSIAFTAPAREEAVTAEANPEEIELDDQEEEEGAEAGTASGVKEKGVKIEQKKLPAALFGGLKEQAEEEQKASEGAGEEPPSPMGALARLRKGGR